MRLLLGRVSLIKAKHREGLSCGFLFQLVKWMGGRRGEGRREGEINPQLYGNEVLPPFCQRPARQAAGLGGVGHLGSNAGRSALPVPFRPSALPKGLFSQRYFPTPSSSGGISKDGDLDRLEARQREEGTLQPNFPGRRAPSYI